MGKFKSGFVTLIGRPNVGKSTLLNRFVGQKIAIMSDKAQRDKLMGYQRGVGLPEGHTWKSYTFLLLSTIPEVLRERYLSNFAVFLEWWQRHGYPELGSVHEQRDRKSVV